VTKQYGTREGLALIEILAVLAVCAVFLLPSAFYFNRSLRESRFDAACARIVETLSAAKSFAENERIAHTVVFDDDSFAIYRKGARVGKVSVLPSGVTVREKTRGFSPVEFLPEGNAREAGNLLLEEERIGKRTRLVLYNLTGKVLVEQAP